MRNRTQRAKAQVRWEFPKAEARQTEIFDELLEEFAVEHGEIRPTGTISREVMRTSVLVVSIIIHMVLQVDKTRVLQRVVGI